MTLSTVRKLISLNQQFYQAVSESFSGSRQQAWEGWERPPKLFPEGPTASVLDVGCGNGRFAQFLDQQTGTPDWQYLGIDSSAKLLKIAHKQTAPLSHTHTAFLNRDFMSELLNFPTPFTQEFDLIVAFGVFHHIPSFELRQKFLEWLASILAENGKIMLSLWNFVEIPNLMKRAINPKSINLQADDLDPHDYLLNWERGPQATRYCHFVDEDELEALLATLPLQIEHTFFADGKNKHVNRYLILKKTF